MTEKSQSPLLLPTPQDEKIPSSRRAPMPTQGATSTTADTLSPQRPTTHPEEKLTDGDVSRRNSILGETGQTLEFRIAYVVSDDRNQG